MMMPTYKEIQEYIKEKYDISVKTCWIADAKERCGLKVRKAWNRKCLTERLNPCPDYVFDIIEETFVFFKVL